MRRNISGITIERTRVHSGTNVPRKALLIVSVALAAAFFAFAPFPAGAAQASAHAGQTASSAATPAKKPVKKRRKSSSSRRSSQKAPTADRITEIQSALARGGYYQGDPNGKWDAASIAAMQKFQSSNGLDANGKLDALSLQKLGLGSDIAGVSAPKQPAKPSGTASLTQPATSPSPTSGNLAGNTTVAASTSASR